MKIQLIKSLNGMGLGLLSTLVVGTILVQIGHLFHIEWFLSMGGIAKVFMSAAIGAGVATSLGVPSLIVFACLVTASIGGGSIHLIDGQMILTVGDPAGAFVAAVATCLVGQKIMGKTIVDIILVPMICLMTGGLTGMVISPIVGQLTELLGHLINYGTELQPILMGAIVSIIMSGVILSPISSAALATSLGLSGLAAGAAVVGCSASMVGFAVASFSDNGIQGLLSQGVGTSKIQFGNAIKNPYIIIPPTIASLIVGILSTTVFNMSCNSVGAGMGSSGFVGQIQTVAVMGVTSIPSIMILHFILPATISYLVTTYLKRVNKIEKGDMKLQFN